MVRSVVRISRWSSEPIIGTVPHTVKDDNIRIDKISSNALIIKPQINLEKTNQLNIDWEGYREYLTNLNKSKKEIQNKIGYGKTYYYILETGNAQNLMKVSNGCRVHAMRALSIISKHTCRYDEWMKIVKKYQLKWKNERYNSLNTFKNIFGIEEGSEQSLSKMMEWIKTSMSELPNEVGRILLFNT